MQLALSWVLKLVRVLSVVLNVAVVVELSRVLNLCGVPGSLQGAEVQRHGTGASLRRRSLVGGLSTSPPWLSSPPVPASCAAGLPGHSNVLFSECVCLVAKSLL